MAASTPQAVPRVLSAQSEMDGVRMGKVNCVSSRLYDRPEPQASAMAAAGNTDQLLRNKARHQIAPSGMYPSRFSIRSWAISDCCLGSPPVNTPAAGQ